MRVAGWVFAALAAFFGLLTVVYWYVSDYEWAGTLLLALTTGMAAMVGVYLLVVTRRTPDPTTTVDAPHLGSIWPFAVGGSAAVMSLGVAYGLAPFLVGLFLLLITGTAFVTEHWHR